MNHDTVVKLVEYTSDIYKNIQNHTRDIADIDYMIKELESKRNIYIRRMKNDCNKLVNIMNNKSFTEHITEDFIADINECIEFANNFK